MKFLKSLLKLVRKYPIISFFILTFLISWIPWYTGGSGFLVIGPSIAGLIMAFLVGGKRGFQNLLKSAIHWKVNITWYAITLLLPALFCLIAIAINFLLTKKLPNFTFFKKEWYFAPLLFFLMFIDGPLEELGWRGFATPKLQQKLSPLLTGVVIGISWGIWHLPEFLRHGSPQYMMGLGFLPLFTISEITNSILMLWIFNKTKGSTLLGGFLFHNSLNFWDNVLLTELTFSGLIKGEALPQPDMRLFILEGVVATFVAIILLIATKGKLGYNTNEYS
jgi:membrane protease YdiL (CAAX protease family)